MATTPADKEAEFIAAVQAERSRQDRIWGGYDHDHQHTNAEWLTYLIKYAGKVADAAVRGETYSMKRRLIQLAALCQALYRLLP